MEHNHIKTFFEEANSALDKSLHDLTDERLIDMTYFDSMVQKLCSAIQKLQKDESIQYEKPLMKLGKDLANLSEELDKRKGQLKKQIQNLNHHQKANSAYKKQDS